ncbi:pyridoxal 5'-phosphate synthase [Gammaproteobacteria bacterium]|nr:pyridoxal 5'-phosphate synthase [Gammaproteobacteria bacterium]
MISFINLSEEEPYKIFKEKYDIATQANQKTIEAIAISSYCNDNNEINSRFVNLKFIQNKEFIFFSNYKSPKAHQFKMHPQITALFYWNCTNTQIRMKAEVKKTSMDFNKNYFKNRAPEKNAIAISSKQSEEIKSYDEVIKKYEQSLKQDDLNLCPEYWGGFSFVPYYFEFWQGHESRINKRLIFNKSNDGWKNFIIQP